MNAGQAFAVLCCLGFLLFLIIGFEVTIFRVSCALCRVPQPGAIKTVGLVLILLAVPAILDAMFSGVLFRVYKAARYPLWEAGVVQFFLALPAHMAICSFIHARVMAIPVGHCVAVWLIEKLLKLILILFIAGMIALIVLASQANG